MSDTDKNNVLHEVNRYVDAAFPVGIYIVTKEKIVPSGRGYMDLHWHEELQITLVTDGTLRIEVSGKEYMLKKGEAIFINRNLLHVTTELSDGGCYISVNFPDKMLGFFSGSRMEQNYVLPYTGNCAFPVLILHPVIKWQETILQILQKVIHATAESRKENFEYRVSIWLTEIWYIMISNLEDEIAGPSKGDIRRQERIQGMLSFIHENYMRQIHLSDIAASVSISVGECCRCFQKMVHQSPTQYLLEYRISNGMELLGKTDLSVTEIALSSGFNDTSHFIQYFRKKTNMTPKEYRNSLGKRTEDFL